MFEHLVQRGKELRAQAYFAHLQRSFEPLSLGFETSDLRVGEREHGLMFEEVSPLILTPKF